LRQCTSRHDISAVVLDEIAVQPGDTHFVEHVACACWTLAPPVVSDLKQLWKHCASLMNPLGPP
jgi:hypothetical protein